MSPSISIRRAAETDAPSLVKLMGDPAVFGGLMQLPYPSEAIWRKRLQDISSTSGDLSLVAEIDGMVVGNAGMHAAGAALRRRHVAVIGMSVLPEFHRRGVGSALMAAICDYADNWGQILRIELGVYVDNAPAIALYEKFGFIIEGTHRGYALRNGQYTDTYTMARLHPRQPTI